MCSWRKTRSRRLFRRHRPARRRKTTRRLSAKKDPAKEAEPKAEPAVASSAEGTTQATNASVKSADPAAAKREKTAPKITNAAVKPEVPASYEDECGGPCHHRTQQLRRMEAWRHPQRSPRRQKSRNHQRSAKTFRAISTRTTRTASECTRRRAGH